MSLTTAIRAPRGTTITCKGWHQEAALRMIHNNLDPEVAEKPDELIVYGGTGRAARDWPSFHAIVRSLQSLENDETLLVQSGRPVGIFRTHPEAPRVLIANSNLVGHWSNFAEFTRLEKMGLTMYGQMTAGSWIYIGSQGIVQGTYETFAAVARKHFGGSLDGKLIVSGGMGGMGGAQPLAATMNGARFLGIDVDPQRIQRRVETGYCDHMARNLDEALRMMREARGERQRALGRPGGQLRRRDPRAGAPRHRPRRSHRPDQRPRSAERLRAQSTCRWRKPAPCARAIPRSTWPGRSLPWARTSRPCWRCKSAGAVTFDYGNNIRTQAAKAGRRRACTTSPGSCPSTSGRSSAKAADRSAGWRSRAIRKTSTAPTGWRSRCSRKDEALTRWIPMARERIHFQGLPARICWLGYGERAEFGVAMNRLVRKGELKAPIVIGRDHLDTGSVASPYRETEAMRDGSDAIADWPLLNALVNTAAGASWVSIHNGGGVGIGYSQHAGMVVVADGSDVTERRLERVLTSDPGTGIIRHADAGYEEAIRFAGEHGVKRPMESA